MLQFDITLYYSLFEIFERTGRLMFREAWSGREIWSKPVNDPNSAVKERNQLSNELGKAVEFQAQLNSVNRGNLNQDANSKIESDWGVNYAKIDKLNHQIAELPQIHDAYIADHELFSRREAVEKELWGAFMDSTLLAQLRGNMVLDWRACARYSNFKVHYNLSMIIPPPQKGFSFRRSPAFVLKKSFSQWSEKFGGAIYMDERYTPKQRARVWLQEQVNNFDTKPYEKSQFIEKIISKYGISKREANRVWQEVVPESWTTPGPIKKK